MAQDEEYLGLPAERDADRGIWRRARVADAPDDEGARLVDLAAFADGRLDEDERERVAALLARDPAAAADVAAVRVVPGGAAELAEALERVVARASALVPGAALGGARVLAFPPALRRRALHGFARWGSLAAAIATASWLGFAMGSDLGLAFSQPAGDGFLNEALDPGGGILRDLGEGTRT